jgi:hypothetical protein
MVPAITRPIQIDDGLKELAHFNLDKTSFVSVITECALTTETHCRGRTMVIGSFGPRQRRVASHG